MDLQTLQSKLIISDYIFWRLAMSVGYSEWNIHNKIDISKNNKTNLCIVMRRVAFTFEKQYNCTFPEKTLSESFHLSSANCRATLQRIINELFSLKNVTVNGTSSKNDLIYSKESLQMNNNDDDLVINWSKIISLFAFSGCLAIRCYKNEMQYLVHRIIEWLINFFNNNSKVFNWIERNGNWVRFSVL
jgi:hypothetical protein